MEKDPSIFWYKGELGFFDNYIIPVSPFKIIMSCRILPSDLINLVYIFFLVLLAG